MACRFRTLFLPLIAIGTAHSLAAQAQTVTFTPGTYELADDYNGPEVDTMTISDIGSATRVVVAGQDNLSFSIANSATPLVVQPYGNLVYTSQLLTASTWSTAQYPYVSFYSASDYGGLVIGSIPGDAGSNLLNLYTLGSKTPFSIMLPPNGGATYSSGVPSATGSTIASAHDQFSPTNCCTSGGAVGAPGTRYSQVTQTEVSAIGVANFVSPNVAATAQSVGFPAASDLATDTSQVTYFIKIDAASSAPITVKETGLISSTADVADLGGGGPGAGSSMAYVTVSSMVAGSVNGGDSFTVSAADGQGFNYDDTLTLLPGVTYQVVEYATATAQCQGVSDPASQYPAAQESAFADPTFTVPGGDTLIESQNLDPVPEPGVWALMLAGFALAGAALRRRVPA
jgi:hypothetical protein